MRDHRIPYTLETDDEDLNVDIAPSLIALAREMPVYHSKFRRPVRVEDDSDTGFHIEHRDTACVRCDEDQVMIWPDTLSERVGHLTREHGYHMDGRPANDGECANTAAV